jgi:hypothetical protein
VEPIGIKFVGVDEPARVLDVPAITPADGFQSGKTRTHRVFTGVLVPPSEAVYGYEGHATKLLGSESRVHPYSRRGAAKYDRRPGQIEYQMGLFDRFYMHGPFLMILWVERAALEDIG